MILPSLILGFVLGVLACLICSYFTEVAEEEQDYFDKHDHD